MRSFAKIKSSRKFPNLQYSSTEIIMESAELLRGKMSRVEKDFPAEISEARRRLWLTFKSEKEKHPTAKVIIGYPAKVIRNCRVVRDKFPDWNDIFTSKQGT